MRNKKKKQDKKHSEACGVHFGIACTCDRSPIEMPVQRLHLEEKWALYRRTVLEPAGIEHHPALEANMKRAFFVGAASTMALLFDDGLPTSIAKNIYAELDTVARSCGHNRRVPLEVKDNG